MGAYMRGAWWLQGYDTDGMGVGLGHVVLDDCHVFASVGRRHVGQIACRGGSDRLQKGWRAAGHDGGSAGLGWTTAWRGMTGTNMDSSGAGVTCDECAAWTGLNGQGARGLTGWATTYMARQGVGRGCGMNWHGHVACGSWVGHRSGRM